MSFTNTLLNPPRLTRGRMVFALLIAVATDVVQALAGPAGWLFFDEILDVMAMVLTCGALGFHPLLLPTFVLELIPVVDWLPNWTGCVTAVIVLRRRTQAPAPPKPAQVVGPELLPPPKEIPGPEPPKLPELPSQN